MNIVTPIPTTIVFNTANVNTESARRDNVLRETIPQSAGAENSAAESGLGSESDRVKTPGQQNPLTYERPQVNNNAQSAEGQGSGELNKDNGEDPSAGKQDAEARQQEQAEQREIEELEKRDREVRAHEQAHASAGGQYAGSPKYEFESGPDGRQYAVGGEVSIDVSPEKDPQDTIRKMQQVKAAALAPAEPSPQDLRVASEATQKATEARSDIIKEQREQSQQAVKQSYEETTGETISATGSSQQQDNPLAPSLDEIVKGIGSGSPVRTLEEDPVAEAAGLESPAETQRTLREDRDSQILKRVGVIENFYQNVSQPRSFAIQQSA